MSKTKEEKGVGWGHPASKSLSLIKKKVFYLDLNYAEFTEINFVKYLASQTLQKWVSDLQKYIIQYLKEHIYKIYLQKDCKILIQTAVPCLEFSEVFSKWWKIIALISIHRKHYIMQSFQIILKRLCLRRNMSTPYLHIKSLSKILH